MSFTFNTTNNTGKVRAMIGDAVESTALLTDESIGVYLDLNGNDLYLSAAMALRAMVTILGKAAKREKAGDYEIDTSRSSYDLIALAKTYEEKAISIPAEAQVAEILTDMNYNQVLVDRALNSDDT